jgi:hypothetical protein
MFRTAAIAAMIAACAVAGIGTENAAVASDSDELVTGFQSPPDSARPWVYWFWLNGNITKHGITADLEAMQRVGIGGVLIMEVDQGAPVGPVDFMSPRWRELFRHVHTECVRLGMEVNMNNDAGWNGSGGPWIRPEQSMQKVVWSETNATGPRRCDLVLPLPEQTAGYYRDICVLALPTTGDYRIDRIRAKALYEIGGIGHIDRSAVPAGTAIDRSQLINLSGEMDANGHLVWDVPAGAWTIVRFGHTSTGVENAPAPKSGRGLECDKLSKEGIEAQFTQMMQRLAEDTGLSAPGAHAGLVATHVDSWENGAQNWTARMREEFQQRRGYDLIPFLPVMTGRVVDSLEISERFLWDLRQTVSELVVENYAGRMRELAHAHGLRFTVEAYGSPCDAIPYAGQADEPMGEFWTPSGALETCRAMASAAHVYGKRTVGAEAFTSADQEKWREHPALLKAFGDRAFCEGINRLVFHRYALQPWEGEYRPGMTMGPWGQHYERTQTWWEWTPAWHTYLARCQFLLRQGLFVADICYVQPEFPPQGPRDYPRKGYNWDECTSDVVLTRMSVQNDRVVLPDGMSYRLLVLPDVQTMTPSLLRKVHELVKAGATVVGPRPVSSPSLTDYPQCDAEIQRLGAELWGNCDGQNVKEHRFGRGRVIWGIETDKILAQDKVPADFASDQPLTCIHRSAGPTEIFFVANPQPHELTAACCFRVTGKRPELWWPDTGRRELAPISAAQPGVTHVGLVLEPHGSVFVVFRQPDDSADPAISLHHNGQPVISAYPGPAAPIVVTQARYGVLADPSRTRDVTEKIRQQVAAGELSFPVLVMAAGDDPALGEVKTLTVDYTIDDQQFRVSARDPETIHLSREAVNAKVEKALYGVLGDPQRTRDVREKLQRILDAGESRFTVARMAQGDDPAFLVVKTLDLELTVNGERIHRTGTDPETIDLSPGSVAPPPVATLHRDAEGRWSLEAREPGTYELRTASGKSLQVNVGDSAAPIEIPGPFRVQFAPGSGAPAEIALEKLLSWSDHQDPGVKYYSGTATYRKQLRIDGSLLKPGKRLYLDLGDVQVMARVGLNGQDLGVVWKPPFRVDITDRAREGDNDLEVRVVNLWPNRMIGDEQLAEDSQRRPDGTLEQWPEWVQEGKPSPAGRHTFTSWRLWKKTDPLLPSGLLGPVTLEVRPCIPLPEPR